MSLWVWYSAGATAGFSASARAFSLALVVTAWQFPGLEASSPENTAIQSTPGIPDFMDWNQLTALPWLWEPFNNLGFSILAVVLVPGLFLS